MTARSRPGRHRMLWRADDGDAALELVIISPVIVLMLLFVVAVGRLSTAHASIAAAARDAARQASISRTPSTARTAALASAKAALRQDGLDCSPVVRLDTSGFAVPVGRPATVSASVTCSVPLSDLVVPGMPGSKTLSSAFTSPLAPYRGR